MARHNLCVNPGCKIDASGWEGSSTPPVRVTGITGFPRTTGARLDVGSLLRTQLGAVTAGVTYTLSCYLKPEVVSRSGPFYIEWTNGGGAHSYSTSSFNIPNGVVSRVSFTDVAPVGAVSAALLFEGGSYSFNPTVASAVLIEASASVDTYFDGDSPGGSWDGTDGLSASTFVDVIDLVIANADQSQMAQNMTLSQVHALGIQSAHQTQSASNIGSLIPQSGFVSGAAVGNPILEGAVSTLAIGLAGIIE